MGTACGLLTVLKLLRPIEDSVFQDPEEKLNDVIPVRGIIGFPSPGWSEVSEVSPPMKYPVSPMLVPQLEVCRKSPEKVKSGDTCDQLSDPVPSLENLHIPTGGGC